MKIQRLWVRFADSQKVLRGAGKWMSIACFLLLTACISGAQDLSTGSLNVTVVDTEGALIPGAQLVLKDLGTNDVHSVATRSTGTSVIPFLNPTIYSLTVSKPGFSSSQFAKVTIQTNQVTNITVKLAVGATTDTVTVSGDTTPILNTTQNTLSTTIDLKQVADLPTGARDVFSLAFLVPGAVDNNFNNLPGGAVNASTNGFSTMSNRNKSGGFDTDVPSTTQRLETTQEMTVETSELDASKGGTATMDIGFLTKRGTNHFHGELFEDYRSDALNANSWYNNATGQRRSVEIINDFGGDVGGPIIKDKLFFFASLGNYRQPVSFTVSTAVATSLALSGGYRYLNSTTNQIETTNVLQTGASAGCATCTGMINPIIAGDLANIQSAIALPGVSIVNDIDLNHDLISFQNKESIIKRFPTLRMDYNVSKKFRLTGAVNESNEYDINIGAPPYPGPLFANQAFSQKTRNYQVVAGFDWTIKSNLVNAFRVGYLYDNFIYNSQGTGSPTADQLEQGDLQFGFGLTSGINGFNSLEGGNLYPVTSIKDDTTWTHGKHNVTFGASAATEIDHYYNNQFVPYVGVNGISQGDPVQTTLDSSVADGPTNAAGDVEGLYATLTGRLDYYSLGEFVNIKSKQFEPGQSFHLHERLTQAAVFVQDSWHVSPTVTLNYGLRWDFTGASKDETGYYTHPTVSALWGPSGVGNIFKPGTLTGDQNPVEGPQAESYAPTYVHPEPTVGFAWNPRDTDSALGRLLGNGKTVIRGSFTFKNYTEGAQNFWSIGSNSGANFNTYYYADPAVPQAGVTPAPGFYNAGSVVLGGPLPALTSTSPSPFQPVIPESYQTFSGTPYTTFDPHIKQPYVESWTLGIQRQLTANSVLEARYVGNVAKKQWLLENYNEVNIFENGFLAEFKNAQANLAASDPNNPTFQGSLPTPIMDQAFATSGLANNYTDASFIRYLAQGQAGAFASVLASNYTYLCSLVGATFAPCAADGIPGNGNYPSNFFQENPFAAGALNGELKNSGFSNYNALQVDFRQNNAHGLQFNANYTYSKSLGTSVQGSTAPGFYNGRGNSAPGFYTLRNKGLNYFPSAFDVRNVFHASGTYDFPFGHGKAFLNKSKIADSVVGGWTIGTIVTWESGEPFLLTGNTLTVNGNNNDSGVTLTGVTPKQLQQQLHPRVVPGKPYVSLFDPKYIGGSGQANTSYIAPASTPGQYGQFVWLHAPRNLSTDLSLTKLIPIKGDVRLKLQGVFLNAFNHVSYYGADVGVQDETFGTTGSTSKPRNIELRGNIEF